MRNKILLVIFGAAFIFSLNLFQENVKDAFYSFSAPFQKTLFSASAGVSGFVKSLGQVQKEKTENEELKKKVKELTAENIRLKKLQEENNVLRKALKINPQKPFEFFLSRIVSRDIISPDSILIKGGLADGIKVGMPVVTPEMVLVGRVGKTLNNFSRVKLIFSKGFSFDVEVFKEGSQSPIYGLLRGGGGLKIFLDNIPLQSKIKENNILTTAALGGIFPEGLLVGKVGSIKRSDTQPFQVADVSPFLNPKNIKELFVITKW